MLAVAAELHLPPRVLPAIQAVEGGRVGMARTNANGSEDLGLMQINTIWLPLLARHTGTAPAVLRDKLIRDPCFNIAVSGAILRFYLHETHGDLPAAVGNYHSHTPIRHRDYQVKVTATALRLFGPGVGSTQGRR
jgi:soluble lytic murein transglycosylase-like protein